ncbi:hypothetical protein CLV62_1315 [Dysgonomonas alginatilytica]|uniref:Uncharacterized protein n=1 Tax=Dysgonomonas alginatilytica TaxID=1605892 RepID=A0A2V3PJ41_9BACT|nr:hypothetical protein [Dysgonomonas alginatilytica]PXV60085.1 hypothetical protein CLV62_1315 [Dysgonomonas alginatilytica]
MKYLYILFCFVLIGCSNNRQTSNSKADAVSNSSYFEIHDGGSDQYNSKTGSFTRLYKNGFKIYKVLLSDNEKESIDSLFKVTNFHGFPPEFAIDWKSNGEITMISPSFETSIELREKGTCKKVILDFINLNNPINHKDKALEYEKLYFEIWKRIWDKDEYKNIPKSDFEYL